MIYKSLNNLKMKRINKRNMAIGRVYHTKKIFQIENVFYQISYKFVKYYLQSRQVQQNCSIGIIVPAVNQELMKNII